MALCDMPNLLPILVVTCLSSSCGNYDDAEDLSAWTEPSIGRLCLRHERSLHNYDDHHRELICTPILTTQYWLPRSP